MLMRVRNPFFTAITITILLLSTHTLAVSMEMQEKAEYLSTEGIHYVSYSSEWGSKAKLMQLHRELLNNSYSEEIFALKKIEVYPDFPDSSRNQTGSYQLSYQFSNGLYTIGSDSNIILYGGNVINTIEEMAGVLSKQYGKHFTQYHTVKNENILLTMNGKSSTYAKIRQLNNIDNKSSNSIWNIANIAANDYVQLFGSPLARKHYYFPNMIEEFEKSPTTWQQEAIAKYMYNLLPQENLEIPLAFEVTGLRDYFISLANLDISKNVTMIKKPRLYIHDIKQVANQNNSLQISFAWESVNSGNQTLNYTLVAYSDFDAFPSPIVAYQNISNNRQLFGRYGTVVSRDNNIIHFNKHLGFYGKKTFRVFASDVNGNIVSSNELKIDLSQSPIQIIDNNIVSLDISNNHWAYYDFKLAYGYRFIRGYPDLKVRPNEFVTRAELLTILHRVNQFTTHTQTSISTKQAVTGKHWAIPTLNEAIQQNIVRKEYYGTMYENFLFEDLISREEVAMLSSQILKSRGFQKLPNERDFIDIQSSKYKNDIRLIASYNIVQGFPDQSFRPTEYLTRAQATAIANQLFQQIRTH